LLFQGQLALRQRVVFAPGCRWAAGRFFWFWSRTGPAAHGQSRPCSIHRQPAGQRRSSSAFNASQVMPSRRSSSSEARRPSSSALCAAVRGRCSSSRLSQSCEINARRSGGVRRTSSSLVSSSMRRDYEKAGDGASASSSNTENLLRAGLRPRLRLARIPAVLLLVFMEDLVHLHAEVRLLACS
jgi:hypothetical protein